MLTVTGQQSEAVATTAFRDAHNVTSVSPFSGPATGGTLVTINGTGFTASTSSNANTWSVSFNGGSTFVSATRSSSSNAVLTATTPANVVGGPFNVVVRRTNSAIASPGYEDDTTTGVTFTYASVATTTSVVSSLNPSTYGSGVTFTSTVTAAQTPTAGSVSFYVGATLLGTDSSIDSSTATTAMFSFSLSTLNAGSHSITAVYNPGPAFTTSTSSILTQTVNKAVLTATASSHTVTYGNAAPAITASYSGFVLGETAAVIDTAPTGSTAYTQGSGVSGAPYATSLTGGADGNYSFSYVVGSVTVNKANATFTVTPYNVEYDGLQHTATMGLITGVNGETGATVGSVNLNGTTHTNAGTYTATWTFTGTGNYNKRDYRRDYRAIHL